MSKTRSAYAEDVTRRCEQVLATVIRGVGAPWSDRLCLVGGLVPRYLVPQAGEPLSVAHIGSTDVDLALGLVVTASDGEAYATLERNLKRSGLRRVGGSSWRWFAEVEGMRVVVELLGDDGVTARGTLFRPKEDLPAGAGKLALLCVRGIELAVRDAVTVERDVTLVDGARTTARFRVAGLAPFIALKADAYLDRREPKDVYDILYTLRHWPGGPRAAARRFLASPIASDPFVESAVVRFGGDCLSEEHVVPRDYARFMTVEGADDEAGLASTALLVWSLFERGMKEESA